MQIYLSNRQWINYGSQGEQSTDSGGVCDQSKGECWCGARLFSIESFGAEIHVVEYNWNAGEH